ncbi:hypothetical protein AB834_02095 [PVC group bacterium (ex Bugula neritina AB1)]|nr:hypothetical protein AB834_02095 [PVC group bacterium (ex Bugula neritina AB1)]
MIITPDQKKLLISPETKAIKSWIQNAPLELEIGCGKGRFILNKAKASPETYHIGLDWSWKWMRMGLDKCLSKDVQNIRFHRGEAFEFLEKTLWEKSLLACHAYFSDPWPKKKHHKRRLITPAFIDMAYSRLSTGGKLMLSTDFLTYYTSIQNAIYTAKASWSSILQTNSRQSFLECKTNYEIKYEKESRLLSFITLTK